MAKGTRKRANTESQNKITKGVKVLPSIKIPNIIKDYPVRTLNAGDVNQLQQLVGLSNSIMKLMQQCIETEKNIAKGNDVAGDMLKGKIKGPAMQEITPRLYLPLSDMHGVAKKIKNEVAILKQINTTSKAQLTQQYNQYIDALWRVKDTFDQVLANTPKREPTVIFEKDVAKLTKKDAEFIKGIKANIDKKSKK